MFQPRCRSCGRDLDPIPGEPDTRRRLCSQTHCTGKGEIETVYPGAHVGTFAVAPKVCGRCQGPLRLVESGLSCVLCGREVIVSQALRALAAGRALSRL